MYKIISNHKPCIFHVRNKWYISGGNEWIPCKPSTKLEDIKWEPLYKTEIPFTKDLCLTFEVLSSNGRDFYKVEKNGNNWTCNCPGFHWRNICKHIKLKKEEYEKKTQIKISIVQGLTIFIISGILNFFEQKHSFSWSLIEMSVLSIAGGLTYFGIINFLNEK